MPNDDTIGLKVFIQANSLSDTSKLYQDKVIKFALAGKPREGSEFMYSVSYPKVLNWIKTLGDLVKSIEDRIDMRYAQIEKAENNAQLAMLILGFIALGLSLVIATILTLSITKPIKIATNLVTSGNVAMDLSGFENGGGELGLMIQSFKRDITEKKYAEQQLKLLSEQLEIIIDSIPGLVFYKDTNNRYLRVNKYISEMYKMSKKQMEGTSLNDLHSKDEAEAYWKDDMQVIQSRLPKLNIDEPWNTGAGQRWVSTSKIPYINEKGEVIGVIGISIDVTERKLAEEELKRYRDQLENMVEQRTTELSNVLMEVKETVSILVSSSNQILAATTQVASGTAETATAITETTATVEEVQQAAKLSAEKAKNVVDSAHRVVQVSQNGQKAVDETVTGMNRISDQMDLIAQTVVRLSEHGQSIGGIIASVTEIADQSNLLAVNAAIEAAKAGEQGKGFSVVAEEIKNLAGQSKQATLQVRSILNDIQKATSAAVLAIEQGSKAVDVGVKQSAEAGEAIRVLAESINEAVQTSTQILASSQQQVVGMDQIGVAMRNINQAGTEIAVSMSQSEKSAKNLNELGRKLKEMVGKFND
jgi:PAS domain S-box-containing protein